MKLFFVLKNKKCCVLREHVLVVFICTPMAVLKTDYTDMEND